MLNLRTISVASAAIFLVACDDGSGPDPSSHPDYERAVSELRAKEDAARKREAGYVEPVQDEWDAYPILDSRFAWRMYLADARERLNDPDTLKYLSCMKARFVGLEQQYRDAAANEFKFDSYLKTQASVIERETNAFVEDNTNDDGSAFIVAYRGSATLGDYNFERAAFPITYFDKGYIRVAVGGTIDNKTTDVCGGREQFNWSGEAFPVKRPKGWPERMLLTHSGFVSPAYLPMDKAQAERLVADMRSTKNRRRVTRLDLLLEIPRGPYELGSFEQFSYETAARIPVSVIKARLRDRDSNAVIAELEFDD